MRELAGRRPGRPWLVVGKGPTAPAAIAHAAGCHVVTLNHACRLVRPDLAHFVDVEAVCDCRGDLGDAVLVVPWRPHCGCRPGPRTLDGYDWAAAAAARGRLASYQASTAPPDPSRPDLPRLRLRYFGAVAVFHLLAESGVREVWSAGVDGGRDYAAVFDRRTLLANGRGSFDDQFPEIDRLVRSYGLSWRRLPAAAPGGY